MTLESKTYSAVRWTTGAAFARAILQLAQLAVLARVLAPQDFGLMAMVSVVLSFAGLFTDMGVNAAFMQRQQVSTEERSSLYWFNIASGAALSLVALATSPGVALFYGDARLVPLLMLSSSTFVIGAIGAQLRMAAEKELNFRPVVLLELAGSVVGFAVTIFGALAGWGVYSLVLGGIVAAAFGAATAWIYLAGGWRPLWRLRMSEIRPYVRFGVAMVGNNLVNQINMTVDLFLGGRILGATQLGIYSLPRNFMLQIQFLVNPIITRVGFPMIAQVQSDVVRVKAIYLKTMNMTASTNGPMYIGVAFFASDIVAIMLGQKWTLAVPLLRIMALWGLFRSLGNPVGSLVMGMGRAGLSLKWNLFLLILIPPVVWLGSQWGAVGIAWAMLGLMVGLFIPNWYFLVRPVCGAGLQEYAVASLRPLLLAVITIAPAAWVSRYFQGEALRLVVAVLIAAPLYLAASYWANRDWFLALRKLMRRSG